MNSKLSSIQNKKKLLQIFVIVVSFIFLAFLAMKPILSIDGWPLEHDGSLLFERVGVFYHEIKKGNYFPLWTSYGQNGYGSPFPFLYHRAFNTIAVLFSFLTGSVYIGVKVAIFVLLIFGALGMFKLLKEFEVNFLNSLCGSALFMFANYTYTNWLFRGAAAEFTSMMLIPWLFYGLVCLAQNRKYSGLKLGFVLVALFYSHVVTFYYALFSFAIFYSYFLATEKRYLKIKYYFSGFISSIILIIFCGPYAIGLVLFKRMYNFSIMNGGNNHPNFHYNYFEWYFIKKSYVWGETWRGMSVEIGRGFFIIAMLLLLIIFILIKMKKLNLPQKINSYTALKPLFLCFIFYFILQTPFAKAFYLYFPGADFIQFPWRLLTFITVISILTYCISVQILYANKHRFKLYITAQTLIILSTFYQVYFGSSLNLKYEIMGKNYLIEANKANALLNAYQPFEYLPKSKIQPPIAKALIENKSEKSCIIENITPSDSLNSVVDTNNIKIKIKGLCEIEYNNFINPFTEITFSHSGQVSKTHNSTYILVANTSEYQTVEIKRIGLIKSIVQYFKYRDNLYS
ncbi:hypothetical protein [Fluviispira multicolorata]|uniref:Membrane protein 6-pyruvoyl-tetrahydropterin synthase-related domain-containing protein n=1 Tax=Fluviispira multicolorata TaxID=2654512 RepID=A0A833JEF6_9BACT|nr:hypothetical protein [Fluviispira multicolorata]KAB8029915.1 hypothetical protein GCL57_10290 [Fluviispira multicolorata]